MPIYVNDELVPLGSIRDFKGEDRVMNMLRKNLSYIEKRMRKGNDFSQTMSLIWSPGIRKYNKTSRMKEGKKLVSIILEHTIPTPQGTRVVRWCEQAVPQQNGMTRYLPRRMPFRKVKVFSWNDVEQLLWLITFTPSVRMEMDDGEVINPGAPITVEDIALDQRRVATGRKGVGTLDAYIYSDLSPITDLMMRTLASAWGVAKANDDSVSMEMIKNSLRDKVMIAEGKRNLRYNVDAFIEAVNERSEFFDVLLLIQKAIDLNVLQFDRKMLRWMYVDKDNFDSIEICRVPPTERSRSRDFFADFILRNRKEHTKLQDVINHKVDQKERRMDGADQGESMNFAETSADKEEEKVTDQVTEKVTGEPTGEPNPYDSQTDFTQLTHPQRVEAAKLIGISVGGKKKEKAIEMLVEAYQDK